MMKYAVALLTVLASGVLAERAVIYGVSAFPILIGAHNDG